MKYLQLVSRCLKNQWKGEYLTSLKAYRVARKTPIPVGDLVLVADDPK